MNEIECTGQRNFLGLSDRHSSGETSFFHIIPVPYDATTTFVSGARRGPKAIIDASAEVELYDYQLDLEPARAGIATHGEVPVLVGDPASMVERIERCVEGVLAGGKIPVVLGGEHTVSLGPLGALARSREFTLVCFDAHADLRSEYQGSPYSHACYLRRASELVDCCVLGVRSLSLDEARYAQKAGLRMFYADRLTGRSADQVDLDFLPQNVYLSIDLDVLDPSIMPSTGTPQPGGLDWYEMIGLLERVVTGRNVLGFDVVELCPQPGIPASDFTAAKLIYKLMGLILRFSNNGREVNTGHGKEKDQEETS